MLEWPESFDAGRLAPSRSVLDAPRQVDNRACWPCLIKPAVSEILLLYASGSHFRTHTAACIAWLSFEKTPDVAEALLALNVQLLGSHPVRGREISLSPMLTREARHPGPEHQHQIGARS